MRVQRQARAVDALGALEQVRLGAVVQHQGVRDRVPEVLEAIESPDDSLGPGVDLEGDGLAGSSVAVADDVVAVLEDL